MLKVTHPVVAEEQRITDFVRLNELTLVVQSPGLLYGKSHALFSCEILGTEVCERGGGSLGMLYVGFGGTPDEAIRNYAELIAGMYLVKVGKIGCGPSAPPNVYQVPQRLICG